MGNRFCIGFFICMGMGTNTYATNQTQAISPATITVPQGGNVVGLTINQNDTQNNPNAVTSNGNFSVKSLSCTGTPCGSGGATLPLPGGDTSYIQNTPTSVQAASINISGSIVTGSSVTISSNTILPGATFYPNGPIIFNPSGFAIFESTFVFIGTTTISPLWPGVSPFNLYSNNTGNLGTIVGDGQNAVLNFYVFGNALFPSYGGHSAQGTMLSPTASLLGDELLRIGGGGYTGSTFPAVRAKLSFFAAENWSGTNEGTYMSFYTEKQGTSGAPSERMRLDDQGHLGINTTAPTAMLDVFGQTSDTYTIRASTPGALNNVFTLATSTSGHVITNGPAPTVSSCGTGTPSDAGDDTQGTITVGGGAPTACTITFAQSYGTGCNVQCFVEDNAASSIPEIASISPTAVTFNFSITATKLYYLCHGQGLNCR